MYILEVCGQNKKSSTIFVKFKDLYEECLFLIEDEPQLYPLICMDKQACPRNMNCFMKIGKRLTFLFDKFPNSKLAIAYYTYRNLPGKIRAGLWWRGLEDSRYISINPYGWQKMKEIGTVYELQFPESLLLA